MESIRVKPELIKDFCIEAFLNCNVPREDAEIVAENLVRADLRGQNSHGVSRLKPYICKLVEKGFNARPQIKVIKERKSAVVIDGDNGLGAVIGTYAMNMCIEKAQNTGIACAAVCNANHYGIAGFYSMMALKESMIGFSTCNAPSNIAPWGGTTPIMGTNPFSIAVPSGKKFPIVLDCATSVVAKGKIMVAEIEGKEIPLGWAIDRNGNPTTNASEAMRGTLLAMGGYKGSGLAIILDILSSLLSGANFGTHVGLLLEDFNKGQEVGFFLAAIDIKSFTDIDIFKARTDQMIGELKASKKVEGIDEIYMPGELEYLREIENSKEGIKIGLGVLKDLIYIKEKLGLKIRPEEW